MRPPVWQLVREAAQQIGTETSYSAIKQNVWSKYPDVNSTTLTCQIIICSVNHPSRVHYPENKKLRICTNQYDFLFNTGRGKVILYDADKHGQWEITEINGQLKVRSIQDAINDIAISAEPMDEQGSQFALESHLRDYLAKHLPSLDDDGISLKLFVNSDGRDGVEFQTDIGQIDILATSQNGDFYVFELKLVRGQDAALGQLLRYMGWVKRHLCQDKGVFGVVVAFEITKKLKYAATQVPQIRLIEYELKLALKPATLLDGV